MHQRPRLPAHPASLERKPVEVAVEDRERQVLDDRQRADAPVGLPVGGDQRDAGLRRRGRRQPRQVRLLAVEHEPAGASRARPVEQVGDLLEPGPDQAGQADDLAVVHLEGDVAHDRPAQPIDGDADLPLRQVRVLDVGELGQLAADDHLDEGRLARLGGADRADQRAVAEDGDAIGDLAHLVQVVRDEEDGRPGCRRIADEREQHLDPLARKEHRRLVEHEHAPADADAADLLDRADDRQQRPLDRLQAADDRRRVDPQAVSLECLARPLPLPAPGDPEAGARGGDLRHAQVLEHAQRLDQPEILVDEAQPELAELPRGQRQPYRLAVDQELAAVRIVEAGEDLDQRRLAGAVLPEEAVDLPGEQAQVDSAQRVRPAEALRELAQLEPRRLRPPPPLLHAPELR